VINKNNHTINFDSLYGENEQLPKAFTVSFQEIGNRAHPRVMVKMNENQIGDIVTDNNYENDFYRYHDIFHYSFATMLGWSPCARSMMKRKRKSNILVDEIEDGARAAITEEAISLIIFNEAKRKNYFKSVKRVNKTTLKLIKQMTDCFEVKERTINDWEYAILKSYEIFRLLIDNDGGIVHFNRSNKKIEYIKN
jgi:hypothetical protein